MNRSVSGEYGGPVVILLVVAIIALIVWAVTMLRR